MHSHKDNTAEQLREFIRRAQDELESLEKKGSEVVQEAKEEKDFLASFVKENPLLALGGALILGYAIAHLFQHRRR